MEDPIPDQRSISSTMKQKNFFDDAKYENKAADEQHFTRVLTDEEKQQIFNNGMPLSKCKYCGGALEPLRQGVMICRLCERVQE